MKVLFVVILKNDNAKLKVLTAMRAMEKNGTVIPSNSIKHTLMASNVEPVPIFGGLRQMVDDPSHLETTILMVLDESEIEFTKKAILDANAENLDDIALMFGCPLLFSEAPEVK